MGRTRRAFAVSAALAAGLIGCELIVSSTVPDFRCLPGDPAACPTGMTCDPSSLACVVGSVAEGGPSETGPAKDGNTDSDDDDDAPSGAAKLGAHCGTTTPCAAGLVCGTPTILTTSIVATPTDAICTKSCCTSADCAAGFVCFGAGTGGNYCVSAENAKRGDLGTKTPGAACTDNNQCRSGVCADDHCLDICCKAEDCSGGTTCRVKSIAAPAPTRENWVCALPETGSNLVVGAGSCGGGAGTCKNDNCAGFPQRCRPPCCSSTECPGLAANLAFCAYGQFTTTQSWTRWCFDKGPATDAGALGAACSGPGDCAERFCDPDTHQCGKVCCLDSDCASDEVCIPVGSGTPFLTCKKK